MDLGDRAGDQLEGVVQRPAVVGPGAGVDDHGGGGLVAAGECVQLLDELALVVGLKAAHVEAALGGVRRDARARARPG